MLPYERPAAFNEILYFAKNRYKDSLVMGKYRPDDRSTIIIGQYGFIYPIDIPFEFYREWDYDSFQRIVFGYLEQAHQDLRNIIEGVYEPCQEIAD